MIEYNPEPPYTKENNTSNTDIKEAFDIKVPTPEERERIFAEASKLAGVVEKEMRNAKRISPENLRRPIY